MQNSTCVVRAFLHYFAQEREPGFPDPCNAAAMSLPMNTTQSLSENHIISLRAPRLTASRIDQKSVTGGNAQAHCGDRV